MLIDPYRFSSVSALATLDSYTSGLNRCCWIRRLLTSYTGSLIRVRKSSGGDTTTEQDIGYLADNTLDTTALATFAGSESVVIVKVYDQSGNGKDSVQATTGKQPRIVNAGTYDGFIRFDGTDDCLTSANSGTPSIFSVVSRAALRSTAGVYVLLEHGNAGPAASHSNAVFYNDGSATQKTNLLLSTNTNYRLNDYTAVTISGVMGAVFDYSQSASAKEKLYKAGSLQGVSASGVSGSEPSGSFTADPWNFGARNNGASLVAPLNSSGFVVWEGVAQSANMAAINTILAAGAA